MNTNDNHPQLFLRTKEIDELLGKKPNYIITWGTTWFSVIIIFILTVAAFIKYPQTLRGEIFLTISEKTRPDFPFYAKAEFDESFCGKLAIGQKAIIELKSYPSREFGIIHGEISSISPTFINNKCITAVTLTNLYTSNNVMVSENFVNLSGTISIIIREENLLQRFFTKK